ncbi:DNA replication protein, putative [Carnobacterium sp. AT7]|uniref:ATP-binding protein n=1 Tax=Carnobacterium sp. AT7 TaxID=333990 RepID=UPI00015F10C0|nr:ATP-binding protein [Carnobacterium sp. AT7]EDP68442.1 DNA replication protein, putative [Carnobacterium sp. AT7]
MDGLNFDLLKKLKESNVVCEIHNQPMIQINDSSKPFCVTCTHERMEQENEQTIKERTDSHMKRSTYGWLGNLSLLADETIKNATFATYEEDEPETAINKKRARLIAKDYLDGKVFNTLMSGNPGTGKSHLSMAILQAVNDNSTPYRKCLFVSVDELMRRIKDSFSNRGADYTEKSLVERLGKADLLVLDDLGAETGAISSDKTATDFTVRTLYAVINARMNKPTIITTNLTSTELNRMYDQKLLSRMYRGAKAADSIITFKKIKDKRSEIIF